MKKGTKPRQESRRVSGVANGSFLGLSMAGAQGPVSNQAQQLVSGLSPAGKPDPSSCSATRGGSAGSAKPDGTSAATKPDDVNASDDGGSVTVPEHADGVPEQQPTGEGLGWEAVSCKRSRKRRRRGKRGRGGGRDLQ